MTRGNEHQQPDVEIDQYRRKLMAALGATGVAGLAGCPSESDGDGDGTGDGGDTATEGDGTGDGGDTATDGDGETDDGDDEQSMTDRTFVSYIDEIDSDITYNHYYHRTQWPRFAYPFVMARKASLHQDTGELIPQIVTDWEVSDSEVTFTLRDDSGWSDGEPLLAEDWAIPWSLNRWNVASPDELESGDGPQSAFEAITDIEWDNDAGTVTAISEPGWFGDFYMDPAIEGWLNGPGNWSVGASFSTRASDHWQDLYDEVKDDPWAESTGETIQGRLDELRSFEPEDPTETPYSGPFALADVREDKVILEKNEHYFNADQINWPEVELQVIAEERSVYAAIQNDILDGITGRLAKPQANVIDQFPDHYERYNHRGNRQWGLVANTQANEYLGDPRVRQALFLAINKEDVAEVKHQYASRPPEHPPGLLATETRNFVEDGGLYDSFNTYEQDLDRAASLMEEAGFSRDGDTWVQPDGETFSLELITGDDTVQEESTIVAQLSEFGVDASLTSLDATVADTRMGDGDFELGIQDWAADHTGMWLRMVQQSDRRHRFGEIWTDEYVQDFADNYEDVENVEYDWTNNLEGANDEQMKEFTMEAPPVGDPEGELQEYPVWFLDVALGRNLSEERRAEIHQQLAWMFNWYLPMMPITQDFEMAFQDQQDWSAPTEESEWRQRLPTFRHVQQGNLQAEPEE